MRKALYVSLFLFIILFTGCGNKAYSFQHSVAEIESIEIVSAENSLSFSIIKSLSESEKNDFLKQFQAIEFNTYYMGDPMSVNGTAVKVNYSNGNYEMICFHWAEYVKNGEIYSIRKNCNESAFNELIGSFLDTV